MLPTNVICGPTGPLAISVSCCMLWGGVGDIDLGRLNPEAHCSCGDLRMQNREPTHRTLNQPGGSGGSEKVQLILEYVRDMWRLGQSCSARQELMVPWPSAALCWLPLSLQAWLTDWKQLPV